MSDMKRVNPALMLEAAKRAIPNMDWYIADYTKRVIHNDVLEEPIVVFDPLQDDSDAWALERALKDEVNGAWVFGEVGLNYFAESKLLAITVTDESDLYLLLKCVAAMTSLPLYAEESMG